MLPGASNGPMRHCSRRALAAELDGREQKAIARRLKAARIPGKKTLDGFDFTFQPTLSERRLRELADLSFVRTCANVVSLGPPGVGRPGAHPGLFRTVYYPG